MALHIEQFYDTGLAHASYAVISGDEMLVIDPTRDVQEYMEYAIHNGVEITGIVETHPHADFVSGHLELHQITEATIYVSSLSAAFYPHQGVQDQDEIQLGDCKIVVLETPGHSPDSISLVLFNEEDKAYAIFTGDTLFVGDVGRPDLRESAGNVKGKREELAKMMYATVQNKLKKLPGETLVYPAHGAGSLCGKNLSTDTYSSISKEIQQNYAFKEMSEGEFVSLLLEDQPFIPKYFGHAVSMNLKGADALQENLDALNYLPVGDVVPEDSIIIDVRDQEKFKEGHIRGSINIPDGGKFETWVGSIISPKEKFYLVASTKEQLDIAAYKLSKIGYEGKILGLAERPVNQLERFELPDIKGFEKSNDEYLILDIRNLNEVKDNKIFPNSVNIPLHELRERSSEIPTNKPIMVHCAGGYRSAMGSSIIKKNLNKAKVFDLSFAILDYQKETVN